MAIPFIPDNRPRDSPMYQLLHIEYLLKELLTFLRLSGWTAANGFPASFGNAIMASPPINDPYMNGFDLRHYQILEAAIRLQAQRLINMPDLVVPCPVGNNDNGNGNATPRNGNNGNGNGNAMPRNGNNGNDNGNVMPRNGNNATPPRNDDNATPPRNDDNATPPRNDDNTTPPRNDDNTTPPRNGNGGNAAAAAAAVNVAPRNENGGNAAVDVASRDGNGGHDAATSRRDGNGGHDAATSRRDGNGGHAVATSPRDGNGDHAVAISPRDGNGDHAAATSPRDARIAAAATSPRDARIAAAATSPRDARTAAAAPKPQSRAVTLQVELCPECYFDGNDRKLKVVSVTRVEKTSADGVPVYEEEDDTDLLHHIHHACRSAANAEPATVDRHHRNHVGRQQQNGVSLHIQERGLKVIKCLASVIPKDTIETSLLTAVFVVIGWKIFIKQ